jgi:hypothetical protein
MIYDLAGGDFRQVDYIERNMTPVELIKWVGINHYLAEKQKED